MGQPTYIVRIDGFCSRCSVRDRITRRLPLQNMAKDKFDETKSVRDVLIYSFVIVSSFEFRVAFIDLFTEDVGEYEQCDDLGFGHCWKDCVSQI